jgi:hypothetical protein
MYVCAVALPYSHSQVQVKVAGGSSGVQAFNQFKESLNAAS